jgi:hypothetical protein
MLSMILELSEPITSALLTTADPEVVKNQKTFYMMTGLMVGLTLISGVLIYYSLNFAHAQHGHDDH